MNLMSQTFCPLPFNHIYIHPTNRASVCCVFNKKEEYINGLSNIKEYKNLSDHLTHPFIKSIQQKMLKGERVKGCETCYFNEEHGYKSIREREIELWNIDIDNLKLQYIEVTFGNYCNLACRTCNADLSHSWVEDNNKLKDNQLPSVSTKTRINIEREWKNEDLKDLEYLKITGGEPMLHPDFPKFLEKLNRKNIKMFIFTNTSWVPKQRILDMLLEFKHCQIFLSIDGIGTVQEYMRHNSKWDIVEKAACEWLKFMKYNNNIQVSWCPTWSLMNGSYYIDICNWWLKTINEILGKRANDCGLVKTNFVSGPAYYQMGLLSNREELKNKAKHYITELNFKNPLHWSGIDEIIEMTEAYIQFFDKDVPPKNELDTYYKVTEKLDEWRDQSLKQMVPLTYKAMYKQAKL